MNSRLNPAPVTAGLWVLLWACQEMPEFVVAPDIDLPFFLIFEGEGRAPEASGPHGWGDQMGGFRFGVSGFDEIHLLSVDLDAILGPRLRDSPYTRDQLQLKIGYEPCADGRSVDGGLSFPIKEGQGQLFELEGSRFVPRALSDRPAALWRPTGDPACFETPPIELEPFAVEPLLYPDGGPQMIGLGASRGINGVHALEDGRAVVTTRKGVLVLTPGEPGPTRPEDIWRSSAFPRLYADGNEWSIDGFDLIETSTSSDDLELAIILVWDIEDAGEESALVSLRRTASGFSAPVGRLASPQRIRFVTAERAGEWIAGGRLGQLYRRPRDAPDFVRVDLSDSVLEGVELRDWLPGPDEREPDIFSDSAGAFYFGRLDEPHSFRAEAGRGNFEPPAATLGNDTGGLEIYYAVGSPEFQHRQANGARRVLSGYLPASFAACAGEMDACGGRSFALGAQSYLTTTPARTLLLASTSCSAIVEYQPSEGCARPVLEGDQPIELIERRLTSLEATAPGLFVGGRELMLLYAPWVR